MRSLPLVRSPVRNISNYLAYPYSVLLHRHSDLHSPTGGVTVRRLIRVLLNPLLS